MINLCSSLFWQKWLKTNINLASEQGVVLQCFCKKDGWGSGRAIRRRCGLYWFSYFWKTKTRAKWWICGIGSHSFYLSAGYFYWLVIRSKFHSFFCYKRFSFSKSNLKYMTKILIDIQLAILKKTRLINLAADLCFEFIICHLLHSQAWYYLL